MKRLALAAIAAATFAAPLALAAPAFADDDRGRHERRWEDDRRHDDHRGRHDRGWERHDRDDDDDDRYERRHYRDHYYDRRADWQHDQWRRERWDDRRYNGYHYQGRWYYGPPPRHYRDVRYDYRQWRRGDHLPRYYYDRFERVDWRHHRLRPPPRDCYYLYDRDRDEYLLVGVAGLILGVILGG
jgi:Ni/Co efflux regulator RcnB